jgi:hypothetical protein
VLEAQPWGQDRRNHHSRTSALRSTATTLEISGLLKMYLSREKFVKAAAVSCLVNCNRVLYQHLWKHGGNLTAHCCDCIYKGYGRRLGL